MPKDHGKPGQGVEDPSTKDARSREVIKPPITAKPLYIETKGDLRPDPSEPTIQLNTDEVELLPSTEMQVRPRAMPAAPPPTPETTQSKPPIPPPEPPPTSIPEGPVSQLAEKANRDETPAFARDARQEPATAVPADGGAGKREPTKPMAPLSPPPPPPRAQLSISDAVPKQPTVEQQEQLRAREERTRIEADRKRSRPSSHPTLPFGSPIIAFTPSALIPVPYAPVSAAAALELDAEPPGAIVTRQAAPFFIREADALQLTQSEAAANALFWAAWHADHDGVERETVLSYLERATKLAPKGSAVVASLRRLSRRVGQSELTLALSEKQVAAGGSNNLRAATLIEAAALRRNDGDPGGALTMLHRALELAPGSILALSWAHAIEVELKRFDRALDSLDRLAENLSSSEEQSIVLFQAGSLCEQHHSDKDGARIRYERALDADPRNYFALAALCDLLVMEQRWSDLARWLERLAEVDSVDVAQHLLRAGTLHLDRTKDLAAACRTLRAAANRAPHALAPLQRLALALEARCQWDELCTTLHRELYLTVDGAGRAVIARRIGWLRQYMLGDREGAVEAYVAALGYQPRFVPSLQSLGLLFRQQERWDELLQLILPESEGTASQTARVERLLEAGDLLTTKLEKPADAVICFSRALEIQPGFPLAFWRLQRLLIRLGRHKQLVELLTNQIEVTSDIKTRHQLLLELAALQAEKLADPDAAIKTLSVARQVSEDRSASARLAELYEQTGHLTELVDLLLAQAEDSTDLQLTQSFRLRAAEVLEKLDESERALGVLWNVLEAEPENRVAIRATGRIYFRLERWDDLVALHRHELRHSSKERFAELQLRIAHILDEHAANPDGALRAYHAALQSSPGNIAALDALERLLRRLDRPLDLVNALEQHGQKRAEKVAAAERLARAAELCANRLEDLERAAKLFEAAAMANPREPAASLGLVSALLRQKKLQAACDRLDQLAASSEDDIQIAHLKWRALHLGERHLGHTIAPEQIVELQVSPHFTYLRHEILRLTRSSTSDAAIGGALIDLADRTKDASLAAAALLEASSRFERLGEPEIAAGAAQAAFRKRADQLDTIWPLQRALYEQKKWDELATVLELEATFAGEMDARVLAEAALAHLAAGKTRQAIEVAERCLDHEESSLAGLRLLAQLAFSCDRSEELAGHLDRMAATCRDVENRRVLAIAASDIWRRQQLDRKKALASLQQTLLDDAGQPDVFARAETLLAQLERYVELGELYARRIDSCDDVPQRIELLRLHARLCRDRLDETARAIALLDELLTLADDDVEALAEQIELLEQSGRWSDAVKRLEQLLEACDERAVRENGRLRLARIWIEELHQPGRARALLEKTLHAFEDDQTARQLLVRAYVLLESWSAAKALFEELAAGQTAAPALKIWALLQLADAAGGGMRDEAVRDSAEQRAFVLAAADRSTLSQVAQRYVLRGDAARLCEVVGAVLAGQGSATKLLETARATEDSQLDNTGGRRRLQLLLARVLLEQRGDAAGALEHARAVLVSDHDDREAMLVEALAQQQRSDPETAVAGFRTLALGDDNVAVEALRGLARLLSPLGQPIAAAAADAVLALRGAESSEAQIELQPRVGAPQGQASIGAIELDKTLESFATVLELVLPHLGSVYEMPLSNRLSSDDAVTQAVAKLARSLDVQGLQVSVQPGEQPAWAGVGEPLALCIVPMLAQEPLSERFRFWVGRALASAISPCSLLERLADDELDRTLLALREPKPLETAIQKLRKRLMRAIPRRVRRQLETLELPDGVPAGLWPHYRRSEQQRADALGLLFCANPKVALGELSAAIGDSGAHSERLSALIAFSLSEDLAPLYRRLWAPRS